MRILIVFLFAIFLTAQLSAATETISEPLSYEPAKTHFWGLAGAVFPGIILRGSGHFLAGDRETARDLLITQGASLGVMFAGFIPLAVTGNAAALVPFTYTATFFGGTHFFSSWGADILGVSGLGTVTSAAIHPYSRSWLAAGYISQDDTESDIYGLYRFEGQWSYGRYFVRGGLEHEKESTYQNWALRTGALLWEPYWGQLHAYFDGHRDISNEGFSLTSVNALAELTIHPERFNSRYAKRFRGIGWYNALGFGRQYIHLRDTPDFRNDAYFANLILIHGIRTRITRFTEFTSAFHFRKDNILGGASLFGGTFWHQLEVMVNTFFARASFEHGRGYRFTLLSGVHW